MDKERDSNKSDILVKFIDSQYVKSSPFGDNKVGERAYRRAEKIATAIILLTNHVPNQEPIKGAIRQVLTSFMTQVLNIRDELRSVNSENTQLVRVSIRTLISYLKFIAISGYISFQNAEVVSESLDELAGFITTSYRSNMSERTYFRSEDLSDVRDVSGVEGVHKGAAGQSALLEQRLEPGQFGDVGNTGLKQVVTSSKRQGAGLTTRAASIIGVLQERGAEVGIKDIAANLPEYSEKMIQRELSELVDRGLIQKRGLKRWSRYSIQAIGSKA